MVLICFVNYPYSSFFMSGINSSCHIKLPIDINDHIYVCVSSKEYSDVQHTVYTISHELLFYGWNTHIYVVLGISDRLVG